ncbi:MAG: hypothetical protein AB7G25_06680 [Sphingomonadaceae bacterium]
MATNTVTPGAAPAKRDLASKAQDIQLSLGQLAAVLWAIDENIPDDPARASMEEIERAISLCKVAGDIANRTRDVAEEIEVEALCGGEA